MSDWLILAAIIGGTLIVLVLVLAFIGRDRQTRRVRIGFFIDHEREEEEADELR